MIRVSMLVDHGVDIEIVGHEIINILLIAFLMLLVKFLDHVSQPYSEKI